MRTTKWERAVPVYGVPVLTRAFYVLASIFGVALILTVWREYFGLANPVSGMTDGFAWGIWKTFNVMVLTGLGSGGFAVGIGAWIFNNHKLHTVMRTALLTSFMAYGTGLVMLGIDVGRPWNFYWVALPWAWNGHSPLLEVAVCVSLYTCVPLLLENVPPVLEYFIYKVPNYRPTVEKIEAVFTKVYPFIIALAYLLPMMHQSSLGALMLLAGPRLSGLWQSPFLPLLYVWAAAWLGYSCVVLALVLPALAWKRPLDLDVLGLLNKIAVNLVLAWTAFRFLVILVRGDIGLAFQFTSDAFLFWLETATILGAALVLRSESGKKVSKMFYAHCVLATGGMIYRFSPTTLAFHPRGGALYFPAAMELITCMGFISLGIMGYLFAVKKLAILPASIEDWKKMEAYEAKAPKDPFARYLSGKQYATAD
ncbi:MAG TPA: Ni/Fe-hydrogenase cytochrome b subunit [candidate division Zixibacteria bacterium]|nr:Ni/Fe-hydrogenase cytochrome b subunit [candidate division Zixibacteria bacterium]